MRDCPNVEQDAAICIGVQMTAFQLAVGHVVCASRHTEAGRKIQDSREVKVRVQDRRFLCIEHDARAAFALAPRERTRIGDGRGAE
jgi:hypothetical protein